MPDCTCTFTGWQHHAEGDGDTGAAWITRAVGTWTNVGSDIISSLKVEGECALLVAEGYDGANPMDYVYFEGVYNYPLPTGNDNINSVRLQCTGNTDQLVLSPFGFCEYSATSTVFLTL